MVLHTDAGDFPFWNSECEAVRATRRTNLVVATAVLAVSVAIFLSLGISSGAPLTGILVGAGLALPIPCGIALFHRLQPRGQWMAMPSGLSYRPQGREMSFLEWARVERVRYRGHGMLLEGGGIRIPFPSSMTSERNREHERCKAAILAALEPDFDLGISHGREAPKLIEFIAATLTYGLYAAAPLALAFFGWMRRRASSGWAFGTTILLGLLYIALTFYFHYLANDHEFHIANPKWRERKLRVSEASCAHAPPRSP